jgi:fructose-1,6-bisphosphatase II
MQWTVRPSTRCARRWPTCRSTGGSSSARARRTVESFAHGDVERCLRPARAEGDLDLVVGVGGAPEGVLTAAAVRALGGWMQSRLAPQSATEADRLAAAGVAVDRVAGLDELCGEVVAVFLTAVTPCDLGPGLRLAPGESWQAGSADVFA